MIASVKKTDESIKYLLLRQYGIKVKKSVKHIYNSQQSTICKINKHTIFINKQEKFRPLHTIINQ